MSPTCRNNCRPSALTAEEADRSGLFAQAHGGTLFLNEVGDLPRALQAKVLDVLETKRVHPLGGRPQPADVRIIATTGSNLDEACRIYPTALVRQTIGYP